MSSVESSDIHGEIRKVDVSELIWRPSAYGICIHEDKVLLSKQFGDRYDLPGGGLDLGETPSQAATREIREETGIVVETKELLDFHNSFFTFAHSSGEHYHCLMFYYACDMVGGELGDVSFDESELEYAEDPEWVHINDLKNIKVASTFDWRGAVVNYYENSRD